MFGLGPIQMGCHYSNAADSAAAASTNAWTTSMAESRKRPCADLDQLINDEWLPQSTGCPRCRTTSRDDVAMEEYKGFPLLQSLLLYKEMRNAALEKEGCPQIQYPRSNEGWIKSLFLVKGRALDLILLPWLIVVAHTTIYTCLQELYFSDLGLKDPLQTWDIFFTFVLNSTLGFLLVFRLNRAADRFWTARYYWGDIVAKGRTIVSGLMVHGNHCPIERDHAIRWLLACFISIMELLRERSEFVPDMFAGLLTNDEFVQLQQNKHPPLFAVQCVRRHLTNAFHVTPETPSTIAYYLTGEFLRLESQLNVIMDGCGGMERIKGTPLPVVYVSHLRTFLFLSLLLFPYIWGPSWGWSTIPLVALAAFAWLGIDAAAAECEAPFDRMRVNALDMDSYCEGFIATTLQEIQNHADSVLETREK